ncbi:serine/threonine protein kinase, putative [Plasmodium knowlesi strain H]|uniref:Aurora kinase n=3 Tax=Plasmodium knowlesi TaxID=5850 RepID=A0A5K1V419_PLAKH|nr:aurora-related kinase 2, putative [Plasmodium knowlesi strain H]OTN65975.1 putative Serine/threonine protein kinase [Plasmodium knowlesi]CAA9987975.1 aurora-related kinase 2, putative [Plasmodium knowlesi strain H]SBO22118.1 serine/threonine protein kinase, putative [Plasmodium knowlesi strain H]SBO29168.1 serine/threonine protein kinase, putative [Plasmodium knowlesi strain H]VVS77449.1 aurora-related kinase 2, putative [Plasmodium knowlesi strain H]|eukprot:XP_002258954.1 serine/threonine protein kinase, putative [Plasmodium knowlesi strain H]
MNRHRPMNDHVNINNKRFHDDGTTKRRNRNTHSEQPHQVDKSHNERKINSAQTVMYSSRTLGGKNPQCEEVDTTTKRANLLSAQRQLHNISSKTEKEKREIKRDLLLRRGDYYSQGTKTTHIRSPEFCDEKFKRENRLNCSGRKTEPSSTIRTQLTHRRDVLVRSNKNNNISCDSVCKRKVDWDDELENKKLKPSHSHGKSGHVIGSAISFDKVENTEVHKRGEEAEDPRRRGTGEDAYFSSIGRKLPIGEQKRRNELSGGNLGMNRSGEEKERMRPCVSGKTSEGTSLVIEERRGESFSFASCVNDKVEDGPLNARSRGEHLLGVHIKPGQHISHGSYVEVMNDDGNPSLGTIPKSAPANNEEVDGSIGYKERGGMEEKDVSGGHTDQREDPLNRNIPISVMKKGEEEEKYIHSKDDSCFFRKKSMDKERIDKIALDIVNRWNVQSTSPAGREDTNKALPSGGNIQEGNIKGFNDTQLLFNEIKNSYKERVSDDSQKNRPMKKPPEDESSHLLQRRGELSTRNFSDDAVVEEVRKTYKSDKLTRDIVLNEESRFHSNEDTDMVKKNVMVHEVNASVSAVPIVHSCSNIQREEAPPPNRRFAAHTLSSNSKNIKTIKVDFKEAQKKGVPDSQRGSAVTRGGATTQLIKKKNKGIIQNEGEGKNTTFLFHQRDKDISGLTFTRGISKRTDGKDASDGLRTPSGHPAARSALPKDEKDKSGKTIQMRKMYGHFRLNRGMATHGRNTPEVGDSITGRISGHPGRPRREAKTNTMEGLSTLPSRTNLVLGDEEKIKRDNALGGNKGIHSDNSGHSRNEPSSRALHARTTDIDNNNRGSYSSVKTSRTLLSIASSSSLRGAKVSSSEKGKKIMAKVYRQGSRIGRGEEEKKTGITKRNNDNRSHGERIDIADSMSKSSENAIGRGRELSGRRALVHVSKCRDNAPEKSTNQADGANKGSSHDIESKRNVEKKLIKDESPRCNLTHFSNSKKGTKNSHLNYKDPISEEMERHRMDQKKKKNVKSNSIPPGNMNKGGKSNNSKNIFSGRQYECSGKGDDGEAKNRTESRASTYRKRSDSYDERVKHPKGGGSTSGGIGCSHDEGRRSFEKETMSDKSRRQESISSSSQRERKEMSYFEWLAKEKKKKEEGMNPGEVTVVGDGASTQGGSVDADATACEVGKKNPLSDALQEENYHLMLQPLSAFNLKQNERNFEQEDFIVDKNPIGNGRTGLVFKAIIKKENEYVALKVMAKDTIASLNIERQVLKEIIIQASLNHKNILQLIAYFEDRTRLFLILELANGGSIRNKMKSDAQPFLEEQVALYVYQIADALSYLHKFNIIHRDLKPDNILLHHTDEYQGDHIYKYGVIKIADFGFSCQLKNKRQKRSTFCGTVDYMPPEIINQIPYDCNVDLWCLGIVIFELLVGFPPFTDDTQERIFSQIKELNFHFPKAISLQARDLILKLCSRTSDERISAEEVKTHPWVKQFL